MTYPRGEMLTEKYSEFSSCFLIGLKDSETYRVRIRGQWSARVQREESHHFFHTFSILLSGRSCFLRQIALENLLRT